MESPYRSEGSRPSLGFPLGTALLLVVIFSLSGIFSCLYHWDKLRSLRRSDHDLEADGDQGPSKPKVLHTNLKQEKNQSLPVIMAGDDVPRFIAMPCPRESSVRAKVTVEVKKPPKPPPRIAVPLY
ncbi:uncharacterized protein At5g65660-like [Olea europaea var. sylvestris]|uniref:Uncharacterized protein At5g65660-like n=1 Tax=Olea europaea subsp. europaea TaxID=158383 RepID=A0A8S0RAY9_OLEEU|nr:uncharacterized protein At5g65660-like [Olea europaea var. sylvestris]CAA2976210.1 uncharacterized protein At5g65660-like [Olea europaea subsp. europaea]